MKILYLLTALLMIGCTLSHPADERFHDTIGELTHNNVAIKINYGTHKIKDGIIHSRAQTPSIKLDLKATSETAQTLNFRFSNMSFKKLPTLTPNRGILSATETSGVVNYSITLTPNEEISITLNNFPESGSYRFGVVGDIQHNKKIGKQIAASAATRDLDFFIIIGDFVNIPSAEQYDWSYDLALKFNCPVYVVFGNHDDDMAGYDGYSRFRKYYGRTNYAFTHKNDLFLILDSAEQSMSREGFDFAEKILKNFKGDHRFVLLHVPPFDEYGMRNNSFSSRYQATRLFNMMLKHNVDISFAGHIHTYQDFNMEGIRNLIVGTGGGHPEKLDDVGFRYVIIDRFEDQYKLEIVDIAND